MKANWLLGAGAMLAGNIILFSLLQVAGIDLAKAFSYEMTVGLSASTIIFSLLSILIASLMLAFFVFFRRQIDLKDAEYMTASFIFLSAVAGFFLFKNLVLDYIIFAGWSGCFIWFLFGQSIAVKEDSDKKNVMKSMMQKFTATMIIGLIAAGLFSGLTLFENHKKDFGNTIGKIGSQAISLADIKEDLTIENLIPETLYKAYAKDTISSDAFETAITNNFQQTTLFKIMTDYQRQEYIENAMTQIELVKKVSGEAGYPTLKKNFEKQKVELLKSIDSASNSASVKLFEMFPILNNSWVLAGLLVFTLLTTFSLVNGILIRTLCVYGLSSMIQKDETILNPEEPKEIVYSERRPPQ